MPNEACGEVNFILSVCIPTYNRRKDIENAVESVLKIWRPEIEIIIGDNCSTDGTEEYCRELVKNNPQIKYIRNAENIGPDGNFLNLLQNASGKYIQLLSDDDSVRCKDIDGFLSFLKKEDFALGLMDAYFTTEEPEAPKNPNRVYSFDERAEFVRAHGIYLTFVSGLLFNREAFRKIERPEQYKYTNLLQTHLAAQALKFGGAADIYDYYVVATPNYSGGYNVYEVFVKNWREVLLKSMLEAGLDKRFLKKQFGRDLSFALGYLVREKSVGVDFVTKPKWRYLKYSFRYAYGIFVILPVLLMPKFMVRMLHKLYKKIKHKDKAKQ